MNLPPACPSLGTGSERELSLAAIDIAVLCWICRVYPANLRRGGRVYGEWMSDVIEHLDATVDDIGLCSNCRSRLLQQRAGPRTSAVSSVFDDTGDTVGV